VFLLVPAYPVVPDQRPLNGRVCVCVCVCVNTLAARRNNGHRQGSWRAKSGRPTLLRVLRWGEGGDGTGRNVDTINADAPDVTSSAPAGALIQLITATRASLIRTVASRPHQGHTSDVCWHTSCKLVSIIIWH